MPKAPKVGLLPLYLALYDSALPDARQPMERFRDTIAAEMEKLGLEVVKAPICRLEPEFAAAVRQIEHAEADAIVTLHLAYSPSLESAEALARTPLPILVLDTTPDFAFGPDQSPDAIMSNHGIHGVQDLCNLLLRLRKPFRIEAGHWEHSDVLPRIARWAQAARLAGAMRRARVGRVGQPFKGMGDFAVPPEVLRATIGAETVPCEPALIRALLAEVTEAEIKAEIAGDLAACTAEDLDPAAHREAVRTGLAVRRWVEREKLTAFSVNFLEVDRASGLPTVPFLEASKAMARGIGYAGEGDVLTAALVGALASVYPDTTFTEMFCPDWAGDRIFLSHMGEVNLRLVAGKPELMRKPFPWTDAADPVVAIGRLKAGGAVWVDLAPGPDDTYSLIIAPVDVLDADEDRFGGSVRGWIRPWGSAISNFLARYSEAGGTHHAALVYGGSGGPGGTEDDARESWGQIAADLLGFAELMGWKVVSLA